MFVFSMDRVSADIFDSIKIETRLSPSSDERKQTVDILLLKGTTGHVLSIQFDDNRIIGLEVV
ncbi:hypothetical protein ACQKIW_28055 [Bacillus thuringiensis]|uniref:hypothetical protein n=1 Tax=Bacillus thuringiensis TaxID=1428 RepID=UPI003D002512